MQIFLLVLHITVNMAEIYGKRGKKIFCPPLFFSWRDSPLVGLGLLLIHEELCGFLITHNDTLQSVGLLWMSDQLVAETST